MQNILKHIFPFPKKMVADNNGRFCMDKDFCYCFKSKINGLYFNFVYFLSFIMNYNAGQSALWWISWFCWISTLPSKNLIKNQFNKAVVISLVWVNNLTAPANTSLILLPLSQKSIFHGNAHLFAGGIVCGIYFFPASSGVEAGDPSVTLQLANSFTW